jgi:hypothetical protein
VNPAEEKKAEEWRIRNAAEFRKKHKVSRESWNLAEAMTADLIETLYKAFCEAYGF